MALDATLALVFANVQAHVYRRVTLVTRAFQRFTLRFTARFLRH
jgi:hypothetical protein